MTATRETIIQLGDTLIRQKGYNAFSYQNISKPLGVKNAAIHYHFPTKTDLLISVIQFQIQKFEVFVEDVSGLNELEQVRRFLEIYTDAFCNNSVCFVGAMATDWDTVDEDAKPHMKKMASGIYEWLTNSLENGLQKGSLLFNEPPATKALLIITNMMAATQLGRILGTDSFDTLKQAVIYSINPNK
ncbi:MAG: TetR/AcrR family transcriptional regulator [Bacteroidota bacterium]